MIKLYEKVFNEKINYFSEHAKFQKLRHSADEALRYHTGYGLDAIHAGDFMDRIVCMPLQYIKDWLDGKNGLEWINKSTGENYSATSVLEAISEYNRANITERI